MEFHGASWGLCKISRALWPQQLLFHPIIFVLLAILRDLANLQSGAPKIAKLLYHYKITRLSEGYIELVRIKNQVVGVVCSLLQADGLHVTPVTKVMNHNQLRL